MFKKALLGEIRTRPARVGEEGLKKLLGKSNWFKKAKKQLEERKRGKQRKKRSDQKNISLPFPPRVTSVLFVPKTIGSELQRRLQGCEERLSVLDNGRVSYA